MKLSTLAQFSQQLRAQVVGQLNKRRFRIHPGQYFLQSTPQGGLCAIGGFAQVFGEIPNALSTLLIALPGQS